MDCSSSNGEMLVSVPVVIVGVDMSQTLSQFSHVVIGLLGNVGMADIETHVRCGRPFFVEVEKIFNPSEDRKSG